MKRKVLSIFLIFTLIFSLYSVSFIAFAEGEDGEAEKTDEEIKEEMAQNIKNLQNDVSGLISESDALGKEISALLSELSVIKEEINLIDNEISKIQEKIDIKEIELENKEKEIKEQEENLGARLKTMYKNGSIGYIDVLLGSSSISEFVYNVKMVKLIHENDVEVVEILERQHAELEAIKNELEASKKELDDKKAVLEEKKESYQGKIDALKIKQAEYDNEIQAKKDEIKAAQAEYQTRYNSFVGGEWVWPLDGYRDAYWITSWVGYRVHPINGQWKYHAGTDIAARKYTPIRAACSGTVIKAYYGHWSYGNYVLIDHGGNIVTRYCHADSLCVEEGQMVSAGDTIAYVGSTGASTGYHLHFEVIENGETVDSMKYYPDMLAYKPADIVMSY